MSYARNGASGRSRTNDTRIFSPLLYQLSYRGVSSHDCSLIMATKKGLEPSTSGVTGRRSNQLNYLARFGGNNRARTCDPLLVRQVLSQLSYAPPRTRFVNGKGYYTKCGSLCQPLFFRKPKNFFVGYLPCAFRPSIMPRSSCASKQCTRSQNWQVSSAPPCSRRISSSSFEPRLSSARCVRSWEQ